MSQKHAPCKNIDPGKIQVTQSHQKGRAKTRSQCESHGHAIRTTTIDILSDGVLLEIFDLIRSSKPAHHDVRFYPVWNWHTLASVCRRWRQIFFTSPALRLDLQLLCTHGTPVRKNLGCWPPTFPIAINYGYGNGKSLTPDDRDNLFAALEQRDRVRHLGLSVTNELLEEMATLMQEPFPEMRFLAICPQSENVPVLPDHFLGGSAPRLREIWLNCIPFPALPTFLSSASDLVKLMLVDIPLASYISPTALAACLAVLPRLEHLSVEFSLLISELPTERTHPPPETRAVLPSLTSFAFMGHSAYLEVIMARVDTPQLNSVSITYTDCLDFRVTELSKCIARSAIKPSQFGHAKISFEDDSIHFRFFRETDPDSPTIAIQIVSNGPIPELVVDMAQLLNQTSAMLSDVVRLEVTINCSSSYWQGDLRYDIKWLELFRPFTAVKKLGMCEELAEYITRAVENRNKVAVTQVLPALEKLICVEDQHAKDMNELLANFRGEGDQFLSDSDEGLYSDDSE
ncbi:hypothetical protein EDB83DRAFT_1854644 [Lactarius deliciosus]|nr:hypothetical protein EDB83DRAFT_1854644 [Lactarius deliciosus]